jgi:site-specific DNA recombinase
MPSTNGHQRRAILYARVSTTAQAEEDRYSLPQQLQALREHCEREGFEAVTEITDPGYSGASLARPGLDEVRDLVAAGGISVVLAQDRDRFAREPELLYLLREELRERGCTLRALNDKGDDSPEGQFTDGIFDQLARYERAKIAERTRRGKLQKVQQGKLIRCHTPHYGFRYNEDGDAYEVDEDTMRGVHRIYELVAGERLTLYASKRRLEAEGFPTPSGGTRWSQKTIKDVILDPLYEPHPFAEIRNLVSPQAAARLDPQRSYGVLYYGRRKTTVKTVSEPDGNGGRKYRKVQTQEWRPLEECVPIPVPDSGVPRGLVERAREAIRQNVRTKKTNDRVYELSGGIFVCSGCGYRMTATRRKRWAYYRCSKAQKLGKHACEVHAHHQADAVEKEVWEEVRELLRDPWRFAAEYEKAIEAETRRGDPEPELRRLAGMIERLDAQRKRAQDFALEEELLSKEELRERIAILNEQRAAVEREIATVGDRQKRIEQLERDREAILIHRIRPYRYVMDLTSPEEKNALYRRLQLKVLALPDGGVEITGLLRVGEDGSTTITTYCPDSPPPTEAQRRKHRRGGWSPRLRDGLSGLPLAFRAPGRAAGAENPQSSLGCEGLAGRTLQERSSP